MYEKDFWLVTPDPKCITKLLRITSYAASTRFIIFSAQMKAFCPSVSDFYNQYHQLLNSHFSWNREKHFRGLRMMNLRQSRTRNRTTDIWRLRGAENGIYLFDRYYI